MFPSTIQRLRACRAVFLWKDRPFFVCPSRPCDLREGDAQGKPSGRAARRLGAPVLSGPALWAREHRGAVAHLGERRLCKAEAGGSSPPSSTRRYNRENRYFSVILAAWGDDRHCVTKDEWSGTAAEPLKELNTLVEEATTRRRGWPADGARLGNILKRIAPNLRRVGTDLRFDAPKRRVLTIRRKGRDLAVVTDMPPQ